jgi:type II secretory ATPase GspE/PulE/Tfp pilus assembly ATPase PilB-like protein
MIEKKPDKNVTPPKGLTTLPYMEAMRYRVVVLRFQDQNAVVAVQSDRLPLNADAEKIIRTATRRSDSIITEPVTREAFKELITATYPAGEATNIDDETHFANLLDLIEVAYNNHVTDIHFERPLDGHHTGRIRYRRDRYVRPQLTAYPTGDIIDKYINLISVHSAVKTDEEHPGESWTVTLPKGGRDVEMRVQLLDGVRGMEASLRLTGTDLRLFTLAELNMPPALQRALEFMLRAIEGAFLIVGPVGSGKSTLQRAITLHVQKLLTLITNGQAELRVVSVEMPVELQMDHTQVSLVEGTSVDLSYMIRKAVRTDYDVLNLGELNDTNVHAAMNLFLAGKLNTATFHARTTIGAFVRLVDMGVKLSTIDNALRGIISCRTEPRLCPTCRTQLPITVEQIGSLKALSNKLPSLVYTIGADPACETCKGQGTTGLIPFYEILRITPDLIEAAYSRLDWRTLFEATDERSFFPMTDYILMALERGEISADSAVTLMHSAVAG